MNSVYVACQECKVYLDAGYRWAYWTLDHAGVVQPGHPTTSQTILAADAYWNPPSEGGQWLYDTIFPALRLFLAAHTTHTLTYGVIEDFIPDIEADHFLWMEIGQFPSLSPRYCREVLGFTTWEQVERFVEQRGSPAPWWWNEAYEGIGRAARQAFERGNGSSALRAIDYPDDRC
jgi:hypothetical protein